MKLKTITLALIGGLAAACAIKQDVQPVSLMANQEICIIANDAVKEEFLTAIETSLSNRGYAVKKLDQGSSVSSCPTTMTYVANWNWDMAAYLSYAKMDVFQDGEATGTASYDSRGGGMNMSKFISAEEKVDELIGQLFL